jgi:hypothetical protein
VDDLAGELVTGFLDSLAQRGVARQRVGRDADGTASQVNFDAADTGQPADLGLHRLSAVVAGHAHDSYRSTIHRSKFSRIDPPG